MRLLAVGHLLLAAALCSHQARAAFHDGLEGSQPAWRASGGDAPARILDQVRVNQAPRSGQLCERIELLVNNGSSCYLSYGIHPAPVIQELVPSVWVQATRPGVQLLVRVVLPRTIDPRTGQPVATLVGGAATTLAGRWQQLRLENLPQLLNRRVSQLRIELASLVDPREAFVDQLVLNAYTGPGRSTLWIDDIEVVGMAQRPAAAPVAVRGQVVSGGSHLPTTTNSAHPIDPLRVAKLHGSILLIDGRPVMPRMVQHQGEPLERLRQMGMNVVRLASPPTRELAAEARRLKLWLVSPPPDPEQPGHPEQRGSPERLGQLANDAEFSSVLAWELRGLQERELETIRERARQIRRVDRENGRLLVGNANSQLLSFSRELDVLMIGRSWVGTRMPAADYAKWISYQKRLTRPGTPVWVHVETQHNAQLSAQFEAFGSGDAVAPSLDAEQLQASATIAISQGANGLIFDSQARLDSPESRMRALAIERLNLQLDFIELFVADDTLISHVSSSEPDVTAAVLHSAKKRARMLLPHRWAAGDQVVPAADESSGVSFVVAGVPESYDAYLVSPGELRPLSHRHLTGRIRVTLPDQAHLAPVLLTQNPALVSHIKQLVAKIAPRAAQIEQQLAAYKTPRVERVLAGLAGAMPATGETPRLLAAAKTGIDQSTALLSAGDAAQAYLAARRAMSALGRAERLVWDQVAGTTDATVSNPLAARLATLPDYKQWMDRVSVGRRGINLLPGGEFEQLGEMLQAGWRHVQYPQPGLWTDVQLSQSGPQSGSAALKLRVAPEDPQTAPRLVETSPVWVTSPPITVRTGQVVEVSAWVRVPEPIAGSVDGLLFFDSLGGIALAERIRETEGWEQRTLYRAVPQAGSMTLTFALSGFGRAEIDAVTVREVGQ